MSAFTEAVSAALIHLLWQGGLVALLLWVVLAALENGPAGARYAVSCAALGVLAVLPVLTVAGVLRVHSMPFSASLLTAGAASRDIVGIPATMLPIWMAPEAPRLGWLVWLEVWAVPLWTAGVLIFSARFAWACSHVSRLVRGATAAGEPVITMVAAAALRLGVERPIRVLLSAETDGPGVVGWLGPIILLPPAAVMALTPDQLASVLAHELAHIKRHDYAINLLQAGIEALFFYHPAVWWISTRIRHERELCCDDLAVSSCGDALGYARALASLERLRTAAPRLAMAGTGGPLSFRIQRLLGVESRDYTPSRWSGALALGLSVACLALNVNWARLIAQESTDGTRFEVASIKVNTLNDGRIMLDSQPGGRYTAVGVSLRVLIRSAYQVQDYQIIAGPKWLDADRFDIVARGEPGPPDRRSTEERPEPTRLQLMLRALLADRFQLAVHTETRQMPIYALVLAKKDRSFGPHLRPTALDCPQTAAAGESRGEAAARAPRPKDGPVCGNMSVAPGMIVGGARSMSQLATALSMLGNTGDSLQRLIVDRTGLTGRFDIELHFTPDRMPNFGPAGPPPGLPAMDPNAPALFTAVQEQLGLKLEAQRGPVDVLVIDRAEKPAPD